MKKLLLVLTVAAFVACNDSGTTEETTPTDSPKTETAPAPAPDTTHVGTDTTSHADTSVKK